MLNDHDDKHDDHEGSEYHFSDEDISYETESEQPKASHTGSSQENLGNRLAKSKRMIISVGVFFVLVFVVYKMVAPSSSVAPADINAPMAAAAPAKPNTPAMPQMPQPTPQTETAVVQAPAPQMAPAPVQTAQAVSPPPSAQAQMPQNQFPSQPVAMAAPQQAPQPMMAPMQPNRQSNGQPNQVSNQAMAPAPTQAMMMAPTQPPQQQLQQPNTQAMVSMPPVMAVQPPGSNAAPPTIMPGNINQPMSSTPTVTIVQAPEVESKIASMEATNEKLMNQLQTDYAQKLNDYSVQNKALQDQVQTLNSRIAGMETQLNHLLQALTRQGQPSSNNNPMPGRHFPPTGPETKIAFSVQAIIPGRAWLRSENGEAVTVAEGDIIKDLGRVTKIDPYDGVVEVNTGTKVVSLSYGNGGES